MFNKFPKKCNQIFVILSPFYTSRPILNETKTIIDEANDSKKTQTKAREEIEGLLKKNDEYAIALTLYNLWTLKNVNVDTGLMAGFILENELRLCEINLRSAGMPEEMIAMMMVKLSYGLT